LRSARPEQDFSARRSAPQGAAGVDLILAIVQRIHRTSLAPLLG